MPVHVPKSRRHVCLVLAFQFVAWLLIVVAAISIAILANWYSEQADHPKSISIASYCAGWISLLLNFLLITLAFDGLQRSIQSTASFTSYSVMVILGAVLFVETMQVYFYHTVTRPDHVHNYAGTGHFSDWLHWTAAAFAGPIVKTILISAFCKLAGSQEHYVKAHLTVDVQ